MLASVAVANVIIILFEIIYYSVCLKALYCTIETFVYRFIMNILELSND